MVCLSQFPHVIRRATTSDTCVIATLYQELVEHHHEVEPRAWAASNNSGTHDWLKLETVGDHQILLVATVNDDVVGFLRGFIKTPMGTCAQVRCGVITHLVIAKAFRRNGLGKSIVLRAEDEFRSGGADEICASAYLKNQSATAFWKSVGLTPITITMQARL